MLTIAVLTYNGSKLLGDCLASIDAQDLPDGTEKLIIDNGSTPEEFQTALEMSSGWRLLHLPKNISNVGGQNACFDHAEGDLVLFVSNDVRFEKGCLGPFLDHADNRKDWGQIMPAILKPNGEIDSWGMEYRWPGYGMPRILDETPIVPSICYLMQKKVWAQVGGFDERFPMAYEDVDMGLRLRKAGYRNYVDSYTRVTHLGNATLCYTPKDRWRFHIARRMVIDKHFTGLDRLARIVAVDIIDGVKSFL